MVKDEDVCLHCGLCAERCPTYAWDMRKFVLQQPYAGLTFIPLEAVWPSLSQAPSRLRPRLDPRPLMSQINDFAFKIATVNGTGSASANGLIMQAIFRMGMPGHRQERLPVEHPGPAHLVRDPGQQGRLHRAHAALRPDGGAQRRDLREGRRRGALGRLPAVRLDAGRSTTRCMRPDVTYLGVPLAEMCNAAFKGVRERILMKNIAYAGALAALLGIDTEVIQRADSRRSTRKKQALLDSNEKAIDLGYDYATETLRLPAADSSREDGRDQGLHPDRRQHRRGARLRSTPAPRSARGIRSRRRRR